MKVLGLTTGLIITFIGIVFVWALSSGTPLSGEPSASLQINKKSHLRAEGVDIKRLQGDQFELQRRSQALLDVTPGVVSGKKIKHSLARSGHDGLLEPSQYGLLPKRSLNGGSPAMAFARSDGGAAGTLPRIAILFTGLGLNKRLSSQAIKKLPPDISLSFSPYGRHLDHLVSVAGRQGHEMMLEVPMEPVDYPENDPGPKTLLLHHDMKENRSRLLWSLGRFTGYFGVVNTKGTRYLANKKAAVGLFRELHHRGLYFFRGQATRNTVLSKLAKNVGLGYSHARLEIDRIPSEQGIIKALQNLETVAKRTGLSVGVAHMHPVSIRLISQWAKTLKSRGFRLVPVSSTYLQQRGRS